MSNLVEDSRIALGSAQFGSPYGATNIRGQVSRQEVTRILDLARNNGVTLIDTASSYGNAELTLGILGTQDFSVVSKLPSLGRDQEVGLDWVKNSLTESLARLRRNSLWGVLVHRPHDLMGKNGDQLVTGLQNAKNEGFVAKVGVSIYDPSDLRWILERMDIDLVQCPLNVFDRRLVEEGWLTLLKRRGIEVHARSVFLQGTLLVGSNFLPLELESWRENFVHFETWSRSIGATPLQAALAYPLAQEGVDKLIVGVTSEIELTAILNSLRLNTSEFPDFNANDPDLINPVNWFK